MDVPQGKRFSHVYLRRDEQLEDSPRMRSRLGAAVFDAIKGLNLREEFAEFFSDETGIEQIYNWYYVNNWRDYCQEIVLIDALDMITILINFVKNESSDHADYSAVDDRVITNVVNRFIGGVRRIFAEERVRYSIDDMGGVHLKVDEQFEVTRVSTVQGMGDRRYANALANLEAGYRALDGIPPNGTEAICKVFDSAENIFRIMFSKANRLSEQFIREHSTPAIANLNYDQEARLASESMCESFGDWTKAAHKYRHETGRPDEHQPPLDLAILLVSQGTAFVRWLVTIDKAMIAMQPVT